MWTHQILYPNSKVLLRLQHHPKDKLQAAIMAWRDSACFTLRTWTITNLCRCRRFRPKRDCLCQLPCRHQTISLRCLKTFPPMLCSLRIITMIIICMKPGHTTQATMRIANTPQLTAHQSCPEMPTLLSHLLIIKACSSLRMCNHLRASRTNSKWWISLH